MGLSFRLFPGYSTDKDYGSGSAIPDVTGNVGMYPSKPRLKIKAEDGKYGKEGIGVELV